MTPEALSKIDKLIEEATFNSPTPHAGLKKGKLADKIGMGPRSKMARALKKERKKSDKPSYQKKANTKAMIENNKTNPKEAVQTAKDNNTYHL